MITFLHRPVGMSRFVHAICLLAVSAAPALSQAPSFDVASVRATEPGKGERGEGMHNTPFGEKIEANPGSLIMRNVRFASCVSWAYNVLDYQVTGPAWMRSQRYDIAARAAGGAKDDQLRQMLQALLAERFKMEIHRESKVMPVYALVVGKNGSKLHPSEGDGPEDLSPTGKMGASAKNVSVSRICQLLSMPFNEILHTPVIDETGLKGKYDFTVDMAPYVSDDMMKHQAGSAPVMPDIFGIAQAALQEQLGLKLESKKAEVSLIVVDKAERTPSEN
jgi:uncharacterized protein (TIGR03435 family)